MNSFRQPMLRAKNSFHNTNAGAMTYLNNANRSLKGAVYTTYDNVKNAAQSLLSSFGFLRSVEQIFNEKFFEVERSYTYAKQQMQELKISSKQSIEELSGYVIGSNDKIIDALDEIDLFRQSINIKTQQYKKLSMLQKSVKKNSRDYFSLDSLIYETQDELFHSKAEMMLCEDRIISTNALRGYFKPFQEILWTNYLFGSMMENSIDRYMDASSLLQIFYNNALLAGRGIDKSNRLLNSLIDCTSNATGFIANNTLDFAKAVGDRNQITSMFNYLTRGLNSKTGLNDPSTKRVYQEHNQTMGDFY